jgi:hypothetical protein
MLLHVLKSIRYCPKHRIVRYPSDLRLPRELIRVIIREMAYLLKSERQGEEYSKF